jgi:hypothetical protein
MSTMLPEMPMQKRMQFCQEIFIIDPHLPQDLKYLFNKEEYEIVARLSNANLKIKE